MGRTQGVRAEQLSALAAWQDSPLFGEAERAALRYAEAMAATPVAVPDELFAELRRHFTPVQIVELTSAFAWENYRARANHALGLEPEGFSSGVCVIPQRGTRA